jgi:hypothetical protein
MTATFRKGTDSRSQSDEPPETPWSVPNSQRMIVTTFRWRLRRTTETAFVCHQRVLNSTHDERILLCVCGDRLLSSQLAAPATLSNANSTPVRPIPLDWLRLRRQSEVTVKHINSTKQGRYGVAIIQAPRIFGKRPGYLSMENESSWALRDYIGSVMLQCGDSPNVQGRLP